MAQSRVYLALFILVHSTSWTSFKACKWVSDCFASSSDNSTDFVRLQDEQEDKQTKKAQDTKVIPQLPPSLQSHAHACKKILATHMLFSNAAVCEILLQYMDDSALIYDKTLRVEAYMYSRRCIGSKAFFLPILHMQFSPDGSQLQGVMSFGKNANISQYIAWNVLSGKCLAAMCKPYWDVEIEHVRPPRQVVAVSPDGALKAVVNHEFYPNDQEYPPPGNGAYKPQYQTTVQLSWNCTLKQFFEYVFLGIKK